MHCIVSLSMTRYPLLSTDSTQEEGLQVQVSPDALHCVLEQDLVLVQPRKTRPKITEKVLTEM